MERQRYLNHCLEAELNDKEMNFFGVFYLYQVLVLLIPSPARIIISTSATWPESTTNICTLVKKVSKIKK